MPVPSGACLIGSASLDPGLPEAHVSIRQAFTRALAMDPNNVDAHFCSAMLCMALGCFPEAIDHMKQIEERDPLSVTIQSFFGRVLYRAQV